MGVWLVVCCGAVHCASARVGKSAVAVPARCALEAHGGGENDCLEFGDEQAVLQLGVMGVLGEAVEGACCLRVQASGVFDRERDDSPVVPRAFADGCESTRPAWLLGAAGQLAGVGCGDRSDDDVEEFGVCLVLQDDVDSGSLDASSWVPG